MPRALSRLALNRGGPRDLGALRAGFEAAAAIAGAARRRLPADGTGRGARGDRRPARASWQPHLDAALADELPLLKRDGGFVRDGYDAELDEMRALRDQSRRVIAGLERDADRGDRHPLAEDPAQQRARLLHRGDRQPPGDHDRLATAPRRASSTARPWPTPCASPPPNWPSWKPRSPTPPTGR